MADIFGRLGYMERQGSGFKKITEAYYAAHNYRDELEPKFYSDVTSFQVTLYNLNYGVNVNEKVALEQDKVAFDDKKAAFERSISELKLSAPTKNNLLSLFAHFEFDIPFTRADVIKICNLAPSSAGKTMSKLKGIGLIESATEQGVKLCHTIITPAI